VTVPEATVNEYNRPVLWQLNVWFSGQLLVVKPKSKAFSKQKLPNKHFRLGVLALYLAHMPASGVRR
jgi:hypothetical protein